MTNLDKYSVLEASRVAVLRDLLEMNADSPECMRMAGSDKLEDAWLAFSKAKGAEWLTPTHQWLGLFAAWLMEEAA